MSGIYIPGMEMPKSCWDCFACHDGWCIISQKIDGHRTVAHSCPLIAVPDHGRLIDADALPINNPIHSMMVFGGEIVISKSAINNMPTIIPED